jgi:hypothetical protein
VVATPHRAVALALAALLLALMGAGALPFEASKCGCTHGPEVSCDCTHADAAHGALPPCHAPWAKKARPRPKDDRPALPQVTERHCSLEKTSPFFVLAPSVLPARVTLERVLWTPAVQASAPKVWRTRRLLPPPTPPPDVTA